MKKFFEELKTLPTMADHIAKIKSHNLPVVIFGAEKLARIVTEQLTEAGLEIAGYAVDAKYYKPNQTYLGRLVFNFDELVATQSKKYVFFCGVGTKTNFGKPIHETRFYQFIMDDRITKYYFIPKVESISREFILEHADEFEATYNLLADDISRQTMIAYLKTHVTENVNYLKDFLTPDEYFNELTRDAIPAGGGLYYVDCGAYIGDSIQDFVNFFGDNYSKIFAIEPDNKNFAVLSDFVKNSGYKNIELFNCGVWDKKDTLHFDSRGDTGSTITDDGNVVVEVDAIDNMVGDSPVSLIKMDVEGAELKALHGAVKSMTKYQPILTLSIYHRKEDLITIPQFITTIYKNCKFYLRKHEGFDLYGLDLYAIPK